MSENKDNYIGIAGGLFEKITSHHVSEPLMFSNIYDEAQELYNLAKRMAADLATKDNEIAELIAARKLLVTQRNNQLKRIDEIEKELAAKDKEIAALKEQQPVRCGECVFKNRCCKQIEFMQENNEDEYDHDEIINSCSKGYKNE